MPRKERQGKTVKIETPSWFGSHQSMVVKVLDNEKVLCEDQYGQYETLTSRLDNGLADPNRNFNRRETNDTKKRQ